MTFSVRKIFLFLALSIFPAMALADDNEPHPILFTETGHLLGGWVKGGWAPTAEIAPQLRGGELYRHYGTVRAQGSGAGSPPRPDAAACPDTWVVELKTRPPGAIVSGAGGWNALPRLPAKLSPALAVYRAAAKDWLERQGVAEPELELRAVIRIALDGDGTDEVLVSGIQRRGAASEAPRTQDRSFIFMRKLDRGSVATVTVVSNIPTANRRADPAFRYEILAILDLNGDGAMEIVVRERYFDGDAIVVLAVQGLAVREALTLACGG
jgi:hypothetical protein